MRKTVPTLFGAALLVASAIQTATAAARHDQRKLDRAPTAVSQQVRNANGLMAPSSAERDAGYWTTRGIAAPAGR